MRLPSLPTLRPITVAVLLWVGVVLVVENFVGHVGDTWSFRGWPLVWQSSLPHAHMRIHVTWLLLDLVICGWALWGTARLTALAAYERWRFSLGSLLLFTAAIAVTLGVARAGAPDDVLHPTFPLRALEPANAWGFGWRAFGLSWVVNAALLLALCAGCWMLLQTVFDRVLDFARRRPVATPAPECGQPE
jgi:hypothetical protein